MAKIKPDFVSTAKPGRHGVGQNLYLLVKKSGSRSWVLRYQYEGFRQDLGLGTALAHDGNQSEFVNIPILSKRALTLQEARQVASILLNFAQAGKDPVKERDLHRRAYAAQENEHVKDDDDELIVTNREIRMTPDEWIENHSRHMAIPEERREGWKNRLVHLWQLQHGPKRTKPTYTEQQFQIEILHAELDFTPKGKEFALQIASHVCEWQTSNHPGYIDNALILCRREGIFPPPTLVAIAMQAAERRSTSDLPGMTRTKITRESSLRYAMKLMANLIMSGVTLERAAGKTAQHLVDGNSIHRWKASTLEKRYSEQARSNKKTTVKIIQNEWHRLAPREQEEWRRLSTSLREATPPIKGERR